MPGGVDNVDTLPDTHGVQLDKGTPVKDIEYVSAPVDYQFHTGFISRCIEIAEAADDLELFRHIDDLHIALAAARMHSKLIVARMTRTAQEATA